MSRFIDELKRTHRCGALRASDIGKEVVLFGWVAHRRDFGGCVFIDLRDRDGITQVVFDRGYDLKTIPGIDEAATVLAEAESAKPRPQDEAHRLAETVRREWVIGVRGFVVHRGAANVNPKLATGEIELRVAEATVFNRADNPPFSVEDDIKTDEEIRLANRYVDLRRGPIQRALRMRHEMNRTTRNYLAEQGCLELETPFLVKYTPGGARNFLVPSRLSAGKFYALAESPQLYKQLFMVAGFDRYFQIVKCFRDEDLRVDRQPEFTQIDIEMSFVNQDDVFRLLEGLVFAIWKDALGVDLRELYPSGRFPQLPFEESMARYGNDKPDLRFGLEHVDLTDLVVRDLKRKTGFAPWDEWTPEEQQSYERSRSQGGDPRKIIKAMVVPASGGMSRPQLEELEKGLRDVKGFKGLARAKLADDGTWTQSPLTKFVTPEAREAINATCGAKAGDVICFNWGAPSIVHTVMAKLRVDAAKKMSLIPEYGHGGRWNFLWVVNPPLFELDQETGRWAAAHHAFTRPVDEHIELLESDPARVNCYRYDLVLNGFEIGGGSIRLHDPDVQARVFRTLGIDDADARDKFGFLLDALRSGAPPHGGIAIGMDRLAMLISGAPTLRDVIPFPKTNQGTDQMTGAPVLVDAAQLVELHLRSTHEPSS